MSDSVFAVHDRTTRADESDLVTVLTKDIGASIEGVAAGLVIVIGELKGSGLLSNSLFV
jgi:hypothetical protein